MVMKKRKFSFFLKEGKKIVTPKLQIKILYKVGKGEKQLDNTLAYFGNFRQKTTNFRSNALQVKEKCESESG